MNEQRGLGGALRDAIYDGGRPDPAGAPRTWRWPPHRWWAWLAVVLVWGMGIGYTAGTIAIYIAVLRAEPTLGLLAGIAQGAPLFVAPRWPLIAWRVMAVGQFVGVLALTGRHLTWPWPATGVISMVVTLILLAISYRRRISGAVGLITIAAMVLPAVALTRTPFWAGVIVAGIVAIALMFGDALPAARTGGHPGLGGEPGLLAYLWGAGRG